MSNFYGLGLSTGFAAGFGIGLSIGRSEGNRMKNNLKKMLTDDSVKVMDSSGTSLTEEQFLELLKKKE
ncbi:MAG: hypothetical protein H8E62_01710 [Planctomycetes bacterium]|nr:hypothetical protein [Planctomycetota bacterium]